MKLLRLLGAAGLIMLTVAGCTKHTDEQDFPVISAISFFNASPDAPKLSIYLNSNRVNSDSLAYKNSIDYVNAVSGQREISAYRGTEKKFAKSITLDPGHIYSAYLSGSYSNAEFVLLEDSLVRPASGKAHVRFVNMSVGAPSLDLGQNDGSTLVSGRVYKANSAYVPVDGGKQYNFVIREHGSTAIKTILPSVNIELGHSYTIWARGVYTGTDATAFGAEITRNY